MSFWNVILSTKILADSHCVKCQSVVRYSTECHSTDNYCYGCHFPECCRGVCHYADCCSPNEYCAEYHFASAILLSFSLQISFECHSAQNYCNECHSDECCCAVYHYADCNSSDFHSTNVILLIVIALNVVAPFSLEIFLILLKFLEYWNCLVVSEHFNVHLSEQS